MSLHRVLPIPPALSDRGLTQRWGVGPDPLEDARIMTEKKTSTAYTHSPQVLTPPQQKSSSPTDAPPSISPPESPEDYDSPPIAHPLPASRTREDIPWERADSLQEESPASICLCQPDPKVPRPRNAFILYRQHYQASVVAQNPGLANPQISKVIGDHWRNAPEEVKNHWRLLAEEEKARHQKQYPGYRYQPRKNTRTNSVSSTLPIADSTDLSLTRCAKCGGRSISSAAMMSVTAAGTHQQVNHSHRTSTTMAYSPSRTLTTPNTASGTSRFMRGLGSPPSTQGPPQGYRYLPQQSKPLPLTSPHFKRPDSHEIAQHSPEAKRRRVANNVAFVPVRGPTGPLSPLPFPPHHQRRQSLPRLDSLGPPSLHSPFTMGPPPRQQHHNRPEKSLTLAPLQQTSTASTAAADTQAKSLEAMILSIPILNKIKVLARISAPLAASPPSSPSAPTTASASASAAAARDQTGKRGLVIAIDAADPVALKQLTRTLAYALAEHDVKIITTPRPDRNLEPSFQSYLRLVDDYHTLSAKIKDHITAPAAAVPTAPANPSPHTGRKHPPTAAEPETGEESPVSPKSFPKSIPPKATRPMSDDKDDCSSCSSSSSSDHSTDDGPRLPIAILPAWQLTHTDAFACSVDIADRYSPVDHWQWGATVWRGVIGADVTVAVKADVGDDSPVKSDGGGRSGERTASATAAGGAGAGGRVGERGGSAGRDAGVEVRLDDARAVLVRGEAEGGVAEGGLRRVGFEVGEWVRGWADREQSRRTAAE